MARALNHVGGGLAGTVRGARQPRQCGPPRRGSGTGHSESVVGQPLNRSTVSAIGYGPHLLMKNGPLHTLDEPD